MEPRIQYAQTADGVSIALWTLGEGILWGGRTPYRVWSVNRFLEAQVLCESRPRHYDGVRGPVRAR
jgi:hypothetical protein